MALKMFSKEPAEISKIKEEAREIEKLCKSNPEKVQVMAQLYYLKNLFSQIKRMMAKKVETVQSLKEISSGIYRLAEEQQQIVKSIKEIKGRSEADAVHARAKTWSDETQKVQSQLYKKVYFIQELEKHEGTHEQLMAALKQLFLALNKLKKKFYTTYTAQWETYVEPEQQSLIKYMNEHKAELLPLRKVGMLQQIKKQVAVLKNASDNHPEFKGCVFLNQLHEELKKV